MNYNGKILSKWVEMEMEFAKKITKPVCCLNLNGGESPFESIPFDMKNGVLFLSEFDIDKFRI